MISFVVHARNSGGHMRLMIDKLEGGEYGMVLVGNLEGQRIQIDFDNLSEAEIQDLVNFIAYRRGQSVQQGGPQE